MAANRPPGWQPRSIPLGAHGGLNAAVSKLNFIAFTEPFRQRDARGPKKDWRAVLLPGLQRYVVDVADDERRVIAASGHFQRFVELPAIRRKFKRAAHLVAARIFLITD